MTQFDYAYVVGRFQLPHNAHFGLLRVGLQSAKRVLVVIGSAQAARSALNPFTEAERKDLLCAGLTPEEQARVDFIDVPDFWCNDTWVNAVHEAAAKYRKPEQTAVLIGHEKDYSSAYLQTLKLRLIEVGSISEVSSTQLRDMYFGLGEQAETFAVLKNYTPDGVVRYLQAYVHTPEFAWLKRDYQATTAYKAKWTAPAYLTADAVVICNDKVLLVKRGGEIGHDQWALPGGFLEKTEDLHAAAVRELYEETQIAVSKGLLEAYWVGEQTFSHPRRSSRGRLVTSAHYFALPHHREPPEVIPADDAKDCAWIALSELASMRANLFEDHFHIIQAMLARYSKAAKPAA